ncbi:hypothetical protein EG328_006412 [Venturia inaequalis]|uniref:Uncharacterized protein n=1 Tax=Venturia inaequalis TaxID=5025 RepID=A0A8H3VCG2_VENIN|nr:hypothetical protein EG328_006412 [Venturia inaequalis]KAE9990953.1 hypothetical protein EG327_000724 [Venturia inaequalis]RDI81616.1 Homoserine [Venturia inaequalis]
MASKHSLSQMVIRLPPRFLSLPRELRHEILLSLIDPPAQDLFPGPGNYEDGRTDDWYSRRHELEQEVEIISAKLTRSTSHPELTDDIKYVRLKWKERLLWLGLAWMWKIYEDRLADCEQEGVGDDWDN